MGTKSYEQFCPVAVGLDLIGDRWTLLMLREISLGDQRFSDLKAALPGIATNLLTDRLRTLADAGLIEQRELPPPAARSVYRLTRAGTRIRPVLRSLAQFGMPYLPPPDPKQIRPRLAVFGGVGAMFDPVAAHGQSLRIKFALDDEEHWLEVREGKLVRADTAAPPDVTVRGPAASLLDLARGRALADLKPALKVEGTARARAAFARYFPVATALH